MLSVRVTGLAATCCVLALLLFSLVSISEMMFTYEIDTESTDQPAATTTTTTTTATTTAAQITAATTAMRALVLQHAGAGAGAETGAGAMKDSVVLPASTATAVATAAAAPSTVLTATESGFTRAHFALGLFRFCWSYHLQEREYDPKRNRSVVAFDFDFHHHCERVSSSCHVDFSPWLDQLITEMGLNVSSIPSVVSNAFGSVSVVDSCGSLQGARALVVLGAVLAALAVLSHVLRWRRKVSMVVVLGASAATGLCGLICMALVISLQQNDARLNSVASSSSSSSMLTPTQSVQFGLAFGGLVAALVVAAIATGASAFQAAQLSDQQDQLQAATQGRAGQLQHGRQGGIDHDLYRQM